MTDTIPALPLRVGERCVLAGYPSARVGRVECVSSVGNVSVRWQDGRAWWYLPSDLRRAHYTYPRATPRRKR